MVNSVTNWQPIETAPKDGRSIRAKDHPDDEPYVTAWTDDNYKQQGGSGGRACWFSGKYTDHWGDYPIADTPSFWAPND